MLRRVATGDLVVLRTRRRIGDMAFCVAKHGTGYRVPTDLKLLQSIDSLSTHADYCLSAFCLCVCTVTDFSAYRIKLVTSNFARLFIGVQGSESPILGNFALAAGAPSSPQLDESSPAPWLPSAHMRAGKPWRGRRGRAHGRRVGSACVDIRPSPKTDVLVLILFTSTKEHTDLLGDAPSVY